MNPLFGNQMGGSPMGNMMNLFNQLNQFRQTISGNPQQMAQQMLQSGSVSQERYNNAYQQAQQIYQMLCGKF